jgi:hypothetical protein
MAPPTFRDNPALKIVEQLMGLFRAGAVPARNGLAIDVASLPHSNQITPALWKLSCIADTMFQILPGPVLCYT